MTDFDGDGQLDLLVTHGESAAQPISVYRVIQVRTCLDLSATFRQNTNSNVYPPVIQTLSATFRQNTTSNVYPPVIQLIQLYNIIGRGHL